ncbi:MAG TPA: choice-of-anchor tandem repeat GloVer-containing protein [Candidatus Tumulicola sp.]|jgi:uncharacterized repeat protein (TIGR03803 family)
MSPSARAGHFRLLHAFDKSPDDSNPDGTLVQLNGTLYGLSNDGGNSGYGAVFSLTVTGKVKTIYSFNGESGYSPEGQLLAYDGLLYGTIPGDGEVYSVTTGGVFTILHRFSGPDGLNPDNGLTAAQGEMYGTTLQGGSKGIGTLYAIDTSGAEHVVYSFGGSSADGFYPDCTPTLWKNRLYGTTSEGGKYNHGTVFSITETGVEAFSHSFGSGIDGQDPQFSNVTPLGGILYGTTSAGGKHGQGTVFKIFPSGAERTLYNFGDVKGDGAAPNDGVISYRGVLYGTTAGGGTNGQGTIFRVTTTGKETVLYSLSGDDGSDPMGRLLPAGSNMYGTASGGGVYGQGTAFRFTP